MKNKEYNEFSLFDDYEKENEAQLAQSQSYQNIKPNDKLVPVKLPNSLNKFSNNHIENNYLNHKLYNSNPIINNRQINKISYENMNYNSFNNNKISNFKSFCNYCISNFIQCEDCKGYFKISKYFEMHETKCKLLYQIYYAKEDMVDCLDCKSLVKFSEYNLHKDKCLAKIKEIELMNCNHCNISFPLDLIEEHENECEIIMTEKMLKKEKIQCSFCNENVPFSFIEDHEQTCLKLIENNEKIKKASLEIIIEFPPEWGNVENDIELTEISENTEDWNFCQNLMMKSVPNIKITDIHMVKNKYLWEKFSREKLKIEQEKGYCEENFLFHGTRQNDPKIVYTTGFDISFSSDGGSYGRGIYFARRAAYSCNGYVYVSKNKNYIFLAKVLTGKCINIPGNNQLRKPPFYNQEKFIYYDSVTNVRNESNSYDVEQMIIVYNNEKAYPYYLIEFTNDNNNVINQNGLFYPRKLNKKK